MPSLRLDDDQTIQAIGILADVLDRFSGVTSLECTLVSKALRQVQQTRSQIGMDFASRAFATLEPEIRRQIADDAADAAVEATNGPKLPRTPGASPSQPGADGPAGCDQQSRFVEKPQAILSAIVLLGHGPTYEAEARRLGRGPTAYQNPTQAEGVPASSATTRLRPVRFAV